MIKAIVIETGSDIGRRIIDRIGRCDDMQLVGCGDREQKAGKGPVPVSRADVIFCFTDNRSILKNMETAAEQNIPIIAGTTGFSESEMGFIKQLAERTRCVLVPAVGGNESVIADAIQAAKWVIRT